MNTFRSLALVLGAVIALISSPAVSFASSTASSAAIAQTGAPSAGAATGPVTTYHLDGDGKVDSFVVDGKTIWISKASRTATLSSAIQNSKDKGGKVTATFTVTESGFNSYTGLTVH